jgi:hypothetical protein
MKTKVLLMGLAIAFSGIVNAQKVKLESGNLDFLKGETVLKVEYDYGDMSVGRYEHESDYIKDKIKEKNEDEPGSGDKWYKQWKSDRTERFQPRFEEFFNDQLKKVNLKIDSDSEDAKYMIILETTSTEPGFNVGVMRRPAWISVEIVFVEIANPEKELAKLIIKKAMQKKGAAGFDFDVAYRVEYAYAQCGKQLGKYIYKYVFK